MHQEILATLDTRQQRGTVRACVRTSAVPTGLGSVSRSTQHSACGSMLGQTISPLRGWIFEKQIPLVITTFASHTHS
jgi:hypothetical protein